MAIWERGQEQREEELARSRNLIPLIGGGQKALFYDDFAPGDRFLQSDLENLIKQWGYHPSGSPDPKKDVTQFMKKNNLTLPQYQAMYQSLPYVFHPDGTVSYDDSAAKNRFDYVGTKEGWLHQWGPYMMAALGGLGAAGIGAGAAAGTAAGAEAASLGALASGEAAAGLGAGELFGGGLAAGGGTGAGVAGGAMDMFGSSGIWDVPGGFGGAMDMGGSGTIFDVPGGVDFAGSQVANNPFSFSADPMMSNLMSGAGGFETQLGQALMEAGVTEPGLLGVLRGTGSIIPGPLGPLAVDAAGNAGLAMANLSNSGSFLPSLAQSAGPGLLEQAMKWLRSPVLPGGSGGSGGSGGGNPLTWGSLLGTGLKTGLGYLSARDSANRTQDVYRDAQRMAQQDMSNRQPFVNQATSWLQNPSSFWGGDVGQEIARQTSRAISGQRQENLFDNPTGQSLVMQSLAPQWLNAVSAMANQGLRNTAPLDSLSAIGLQSANAQGRPGAVLGAGFADVFGGAGANQANDINAQLRRVLAGLGGGGGGVLM